MSKLTKRNDFRSPKHLQWLHEQYAESNDDKWTVMEDETLRQCVARFGTSSWNLITCCVKSRSAEQCRIRWRVFQNVGNEIKGPWDPESDELLLILANIFDAEKWPVISSYVPRRNAKQCREHFRNQLDPSIEKKRWTAQEEEIIWEMQSEFGNKWSVMRSRLPGRTSNMIKNHWHSFMKCQVRKRKKECMEDASKKENYGDQIPDMTYLMIPFEETSLAPLISGGLMVRLLKEDAEVWSLLLDL